MFIRRLSVQRILADGTAVSCPVQWMDSFAMRNFTNDAIFDDTLPIEDGVMEAGLRVPIDLLRERMEAWFRRKQYLGTDEGLSVQEMHRGVEGNGVIA
jgi:hypothetical protein